MAIRGSQPIIVVTGSPANRGQWLNDVFGIVEPRDVRWIFPSHEDMDHAGNLAVVLERCPNATLVCSWAIVERFANALDFPLDRCRWVNDGEQLDAGVRVLRTVRPPVFHSPTTRGLLDERTGIYLAADAFASAMPQTPVASVVELDAVIRGDLTVATTYLREAVPMYVELENGMFLGYCALHLAQIALADGDGLPRGNITGRGRWLVEVRGQRDLSNLP